jgi:hypothetical protein
MDISTSGQLIHVSKNPPPRNATGPVEDRFKVHLLQTPKAGNTSAVPTLESYNLPKGTNPNHIMSNIGKHLTITLQAMDSDGKKVLYIGDNTDIRIQDAVKAA